VHTENILIDERRVVIVLTVEEGREKPYFDTQGVIWLKSGADKRRVNSKEELRRIFQSVDLFHADELPTVCAADQVDLHQLGRFFRKQYGYELPASEDELNALIHRDYLIEAPIRLFVYDERVELISPGRLPNHLPVEKIRTGNSVIPNPILASFAAKGLLPYRGLGTGVQRALQECPDLQFFHDAEAETFTATIPLTVSQAGRNEHVETKNETVELQWTALQVQIMNLIRKNPNVTYPEMESATGKSRATIWRHLNGLREEGSIRRVGSDRHGHWEAIL